MTIFVDWTRLKAFAENKLNAGKIKISVFEREENIVGKGENAGHQHFLLFPQCLLKPCLSGSLKVWIDWSRVNALPYDKILACPKWKHLQTTISVWLK